MNERPALFGFNSLGIIFVEIIWYSNLGASSLIFNFLSDSRALSFSSSPLAESDVLTSAGVELGLWMSVSIRYSSISFW